MITDPSIAEKRVVIDHVHYTLGKNGEKPSPYNGFAGQRHLIEFLDGRRVITYDLWYQGPVPPVFWDRLPDNARWGRRLMTDLIDFLRARLDERANDPGHLWDCGLTDPDRPFGGRCDCDLPQRLADIAAKHKIIDLHAPVIELVEWWDAPAVGEAAVCSSCGNRESNTWELGYGNYHTKPKGWIDPYVLWPCPTLKLLALPWADHPDYQISWRPTQ
jgi:hypothetical protein